MKDAFEVLETGVKLEDEALLTIRAGAELASDSACVNVGCSDVGCIDTACTDHGCIDAGCFDYLCF